MPSTNPLNRFQSFFDQGALVTNIVGFGLAAACGLAAVAFRADAAIMITLLIFGWLVAVVSVSATELKSRLPIIILAGLAFASAGVALHRQSRDGPPFKQLSNALFKSYVSEFSLRLRDAATLYKKQLDVLNPRLPAPAPSQDENSRPPIEESEEYKKIYQSETAVFKSQFLLQSQVLQTALLKRLGPAYPDALAPDEKGRESIAKVRQMLVDGTLGGSDPIAHIADYLDGLAIRLPDNQSAGK